MKKLRHFLNPLDHLGETEYSLWFPLIANMLLCIFSEIFAYAIAHNPMIVGIYIIFFNVTFIIYFSCRSGMRGGFISTSIAITYYFYIIYTRHYSGKEFTAAVDTTIILCVLYVFLAATIGWLKQYIDKLIEIQSDERRRLETIISQLPVGVFITDHQGTLIQRNHLVDTILGVKIPLGFVIGKDTLKKEQIDNEPIDPSESPLFQALKTGKPVIGKEYTFTRKDGKIRSLQVNSAPILNKNNVVIAAASIINDITKIKELERQKDEFLGIVSHELKTPITSIKAYAQILETQFLKKGDEKTAKQLGKIDVQVTRLNTLIEELLYVTKIQSGRLQFHKSDFDLDVLIAEIVEDLQPTTAKHTIVTKLSAKKHVFADRDRIAQVVTNFITNAIKYSPQAHKIIVSTKLEGRHITCSVQDFGMGIDKKDQKQVFDRFFRVTHENNETIPGMGLGLYISSTIIKREGGNIWVNSEIGKGSTFCFSLPHATQAEKN